jgi:cyclophilin family peptidyl-prolyl cis-trans isomerase
VHWRVTTTQGVFVIEMDVDAAPWSISALSILAQTGFYNDTLWHRVVPDFVAQGGDPSGSGWGGPGFQLPAEPSFQPYVRGAVGIADAGLDTGGSQWFVTHVRTPHLDGRYTRIGVVTDGMDVVDRLVVGDKVIKIDAIFDPIEE